MRVIIYFLLVLILNSCNSKNTDAFNEIYALTEQNNFFKAKDLYETSKNELSRSHQDYIRAVLDNAFNRLKKSEETIAHLLLDKSNLTDSLQVKLYETQYDNQIKLYEYKKAKRTIERLVNNYKEYLDSTQISDYQNNLKICNALENVPPQKVDIQHSVIKMEKDKAGLNTLKVLANDDSLQFIFDTGANFSTTSISVAKKSGMKLLPTNIRVGSITGNFVSTQLAVCEKLELGNIKIHNVVFLVMPDEMLSFPQIDYQIYGILGFPIIEALKEIRINQNGDFIVASTKSYSEKSNMAMKGLTPLINLDNKHFTFDTGADKTILYQLFYQENKQEIDRNYQPQKISFGGAGGLKEFEGFSINYTFNVNGKQVTLDNIDLLKEKIKENETVYGNIGQDLIQKFNTMIINFDKMFISFE